jgi:Yip1 domain
MSALGYSSPSRAFVAHYAQIARRPLQGFDELLADPRCLRYGTMALLSNAALYTVVYVFLILGHGRPTVFKPWLAIEPERYYRFDVFLLAPSMLMGWLVASGLSQLLGRAFGGTGKFEDTASALGFATAIASWWTLLHDLVTSFLGAVGVIDQRSYEDALSSPTGLRTMLWLLMLGYLASFVLLYTRGVGAAHRLPFGRALATGATAFLAYQLVFVVFNR